MRILGIHGMDAQGVGGALRGQEMGYALRRLGHEIDQRPPGTLISRPFAEWDSIDAIILTGTWHQLVGGTLNPVRIAKSAEAHGVPCLWWYGSNGSVFGCVDPDAGVRAAAQQQVIDRIREREFIGVICPYSMGIYERHGVPAAKMRLVPSVFDADLFCPSNSTYDRQVSARLRYKFNIPDKAFVIGTVGHTPNSKGGDEILKAVALLKNEMPDLVYLILHTPAQNLNRVKARSPDGLREGNSEWDVLQHSRDTAELLGISNRVRFLGMRFPRVGMPPFYRLLDIYCSPSKAENLGQPLVESQLCGLPLVTFKGFSFDFVAGPGAQQVEPHHTETDDYGLVIPSADPQDLAAAIVEARKVAEANPPEPTNATRVWAREKFGHHNAQVMVAAIEEYRGLL